MRPFSGIAIVAGFLAALACIAWPSAHSAPRQDSTAARQRDQQITATATYHTTGSQSCSSTACHGSLKPDPRSLSLKPPGDPPIRRDEFIFWSDHDPHARSLATLSNERSLAMLDRLAGGDADRRAKALTNCLACHATQVTAPSAGEPFFEAVGCEACHGPAEGYRERHYQRGWNAELATQFGMANTDNLTVRAAQCATCHIGAPDREVNHDLIAAGHPALKFEMAAYYDLLPKHWNDRRERATTPSFEVQLWKAGQQATRAAALELLEARLARATVLEAGNEAHAALSHPVAPVWPELAEYDCFACHHDLTGKARLWDADRGPALPRWNPWYFPDRSDETLAPLASAMSDALRGSVAPAQAEARTARQAIERMPAAAFDPEQAAQQWDQAVQAYLLLAARHRALQDEAARGARGPVDRQLAADLRKLRSLLAFPDGYDSPRSSASPARLAELLESLQQRLPAPGEN